MDSAAAAHGAASMDDAELLGILLDWDDAEIALLADTESNESPVRFIDAQLIQEPERTAGDERTGPSNKLHSQEAAERSVSRSSLCRQRQRSELVQLRRDVVELEDELRHLRAGNATSLVTHRGGMWKRIAQYQHQQRRKAEIERDKLHHLINEHRKVARRLEKVFSACRSLEATYNSELYPRASAKGALGGECAPLLSRLGLDLDSNREFEQVTLKTDDGRMILEAALSKMFAGSFAELSADFWDRYCSDIYPNAGGGYSSITNSSSGMIGLVEIPIVIRGRAYVIASRFRIGFVQEATGRAEISWEDYQDEHNSCTCEDSEVEHLWLKTTASLHIEPLHSGSTSGTVVRLCSLSRPRTFSSIDDPIREASSTLVAVVQEANSRLVQQLTLLFQH